MSESFAEQMKNASVMLAGLKTHTSELARRGADTDFIGKFETAYKDALDLNSTHEAVKSKLKIMTNALDGKKEELNDLFQEGKKMVKLEMPQESWKEFGFPDQR